MRELELGQRVWSEKRDGGFSRDAILSLYFPGHQCFFSLSFSFSLSYLQKKFRACLKPNYKRRENIQRSDEVIPHASRTKIDVQKIIDR